MIILGTIINVLAVLAGGFAGLLFHARLPQRFVGITFQGIGLFTLVLGLNMAFKAEEWIVVVLSLVLGGVLGELLRLDAFFDSLANRLGRKFKTGGKRFNEGLLTAFLLYCMGSMTILGAIEEGMTGQRELYYVKSLMDGISSIALASGLGAGVLFSVVPLFVYQAGLTVLAFYFGSFLPELMISSLTATGGVLLIGLGLNILQVTKISILNLLPSLVFSLLLSWVFLML
ncbi:MAG: DUF554 domain-containing protein [Bacteroidales bacterium]|nr:DUF554 domain-containing protein [Bacteroidales bacterium]